MPGYIAKDLQKFQHPTPKIPQNAPHDWTDPNYVSRRQYTQTESDLPTLDLVGTQWVQSIMGTLLYYFRVADPTMLPELNNIFTQQSKPTSRNISKCNRLLDYAATYPNIVIWYHESDMVLHGDTDYAYLVPTKACSHIAGHFYLSDNPPPTDTPKIKLSGPILTVSQTLPL